MQLAIEWHPRLGELQRWARGGGALVVAAGLALAARYKMRPVPALMFCGWWYGLVLGCVIAFFRLPNIRATAFFCQLPKIPNHRDIARLRKRWLHLLLKLQLFCDSART